ncbi:MAG: Ig-like domain-containing protein [Planctomycetes bacterium]|nr:Ig-like domain-containing protein [Planctomycetota bacterium]
MKSSWTWYLGLALPFAACSGGKEEFRLVEVIPAASAEPLRLNEPLTFVFSREVDPSSVTAQAVAIRRSDGQPAEGRLATGGDRVTFVPRVVGAAAPLDGGYGAAESVTAELEAFPSRLGVLSASGEPLARPHCSTHHVVPAGDPAASLSALFLDAARGVGPRLTNRLKAPGERFATVRPGGRIRLEFSEPLWPPSVNQGTIRLRYDNPDRDPVDATLELEQDERRAAVELWPRGGFQAGTRYLLGLGEPGVLDLAGTEFDAGGACEVPIRVLEDDPAAPGRDG